MKLGKVDCWKFHTIGEVKWIKSGITKAIDCPNCNKKLDSVVEGRKLKCNIIFLMDHYKYQLD